MARAHIHARRKKRGRRPPCCPSPHRDRNGGRDKIDERWVYMLAVFATVAVTLVMLAVTWDRPTERADAVIKALWQCAGTLEPNEEKFVKLLILTGKRRNAVQTFGIKALDAIYARPVIGANGFGAYTKRGKSWALLQCAVANALAHHRILYISTELAEFEVAERMDQLLYCAARRPGEYPALSFVRSGDTLAIVRDNIKARYSFDSPLWDEERQVLYAKYNAWILERIKVVAFDKRTANTADFIPHIDMVNPDIVIVDYVGEMKVDPKLSLYDVMGNHMRDLDNLGKQRKIPVVTAYQLNRAAATQETEDKVADSIEINRVISTALIIRQVIPGALSHVKVSLARHEAQGREVAVTHCFALGRFCVDSVVVDDEYNRAVEDAKPLLDEMRPVKKPRSEARSKVDETMRARIAQLSLQGTSQRQIASEVGVSVWTVNKVLRTLGEPWI